MPINLSRNTKVYFVTGAGLSNVSYGGITVPNSPVDANTYTSSTLFEIGVQEGYSLSQATQEQTISVNEAGNNAVRGSRSFNTQLDPVDFSFSTYIRPRLASSRVEAAERLLWNALFGAGALNTTALTTVTAPTRGTTTGAAAATATVVFTGTSTGLAQGDIVNFQNATNHVDWNQPARILTAPTVATNTTCTVEFMKSPATAAGTTAAAGTVAYAGQWAQSNTTAGSYSYVSTMASNRNQLLPFGMIFVIDNVVYAVDNCVMDSGTVDFGLDQISMIQWAGKGARIRPLTVVTAQQLATTATPAPTDANYITNKLSTLTLASKIGGTKASGSTSYSIAITGGQLTFANNVTYLTPSNLGVVNTAITYFTGARSISGNVTAYLRTGETNASGDLYTSLLTAVTTTEPKFYVQLEMGGGTNATRVEFEMPGAKLQLPTVDVQDIVSTTINFMAQPHDPNYNGAADVAFDLTRSNELLVKYYSA